MVRFFFSLRISISRRILSASTIPVSTSTCYLSHFATPGYTPTVELLVVFNAEYVGMHRALCPSFSRSCPTPGTKEARVWLQWRI